MKKMIVPDIFGVTEALLDFAARLHGDIEIINPYNESLIDFASELDAYNHFNKVTSLEAYTQTISNKINAIEGPISFLGFSMGGSAIWRLAEDRALVGRATAVCYYAGQVRHHTSVTPKLPITLIMAKQEQHFSVADLTQTLANKNNTTIKTSHYLHGFMNRYSTNFSETGYSQHLNALSALAPDQPFTDINLNEIETAK